MKYIKENKSGCTCANWRHHATWDLEPEKIKKTLAKVLNTGNINFLNNDAYTFVMGLSGFIAHYNIAGFKSEYADVRQFRQDLQTSSDVLRADYYQQPFFMKEQPLYYTQKSEVLAWLDGQLNRRGGIAG